VRAWRPAFETPYPGLDRKAPQKICPVGCGTPQCADPGPGLIGQLADTRFRRLESNYSLEMNMKPKAGLRNSGGDKPTLRLNSSSVVQKLPTLISAQSEARRSAQESVSYRRPTCRWSDFDNSFRRRNTDSQYFPDSSA
jgi:hypothetical protein